MKTAYDIILEPVISEQSMEAGRRRNLRRRGGQSKHHELRRQGKENGKICRQDFILQKSNRNSHREEQRD